MNGSHTYQDRQTVINTGEVLFENYCKEMGYKLNRIGFDEKSKNVDNFFLLNSMLRNLPDYVVNTKNETFVVCVKGTANFKKKEVDLLPLMTEWFSSPKAPLVYAFCFEGQNPKLLYPEKIIELYKSSMDQQWSDGVVYRNLKII
jgi:hypothetical protein